VDGVVEQLPPLHWWLLRPLLEEAVRLLSEAVALDAGALIVRAPQRQGEAP